MCLTCSVALITALITLLQLNLYQSQATLLPLVESQMNSQQALVGGLLGFVGVPPQSPVDRLLAILQSRTLAEDVIQRLNLMPILFAESWNVNNQQWFDEHPTLDDAVLLLRSLVDMSLDKTRTTISIVVTHADPVLCAAIVNQYIEELQKVLQENAFSLAKKNRLFIEDRVKKTQESLRMAEEDLRSFEQEYKIVSLDEQTRASVESISFIESQIIAKEVQLHVLKQSMTVASQEVNLLQEELRALREQVDRFKHSTSALSVKEEKVPNRNQEFFPSVDQAPEIKLQYARLQRDALIQNKLFTLLVEQMEQSKLEEARDETTFQILDRATPANRSVKPNRITSVLLVTICSAFVGVLLVLFFDHLDTTIHTKEQASRQLNFPLLATIPVHKDHKTRSTSMPLQSEGSFDIYALAAGSTREAIRYFHTRLRSLNGAGALQVLLFTSAEPNENITTPVAHLALVAASIGEKTLVVDGNIHAPSLHTWFHCPLSPGLTDLLSDAGDWQKSLRAVTKDTLYLIPAGAFHQEVLSSLHSSTFDMLLAEWKKAYDLIL
ncbi:MAG: hypothetical protein MN733_07210, partial [Nitrososphaera sp.]|nr:hypothetical protein [Nitrososphaera sp.]